MLDDMMGCGALVLLAHLPCELLATQQPAATAAGRALLTHLARAAGFLFSFWRLSL
jgi:hypothetical protein